MRGQELYKRDQALQRRDEEYAAKLQRAEQQRQQEMQNRNTLSDFYTEKMGPRYGAAIGAGMKPSGVNSLYEMMNPEAESPFVPGKPYAGTDAQGNPVFLQQDEFGRPHLAPGGFSPSEKRGMSVTSPDGTVIQFGGTAKMPAGSMRDPNNQNQLMPIPGGGKDRQSPEAAAKTELLEQGVKDVKRFKDMVLDKGGNVDTTLLFNMGIGTPWSKGRLAYSLIYNAVEAKLRAESGAAVPEPEVVRMAKRFVPSYFDNAETIKSKVTRLEDWLSATAERIDPTGAYGKKVNTVKEVDYSSDPEYQQYLRDKAALGGKQAPWSQ